MSFSQRTKDFSTLPPWHQLFQTSKAVGSQRPSNLALAAAVREWTSSERNHGLNCSTLHVLLPSSCRTEIFEVSRIHCAALRKTDHSVYHLRQPERNFIVNCLIKLLRTFLERSRRPTVWTARTAAEKVFWPARVTYRGDGATRATSRGPRRLSWRCPTYFPVFRTTVCFRFVLPNRYSRSLDEIGRQNLFQLSRSLSGLNRQIRHNLADLG